MSAFLNQHSLRKLGNLNLFLYLFFSIIFLLIGILLLFFDYIPTIKIPGVYSEGVLTVAVNLENVEKVVYAEKIKYKEQEFSFTVLETNYFTDERSFINYQEIKVDVSGLEAHNGEVLSLLWEMPKEKLGTYIVRYIRGS